MVGHMLDRRPLLRPSFADPEIHICEPADIDRFIGRALLLYAVWGLLLLSMLAVFIGQIIYTFPIMLDFVFIYAALDMVAQHRWLKRLPIINPEECQRFREDHYWKRFATIVFEIALILFSLLLIAFALSTKTGIFDAEGNISISRLLVFSPVILGITIFPASLWTKLS